MRALLLAVVLAAPGGIAALLDFESRKPLLANRAIDPRPELLARAASRAGASRPNLSLRRHRAQLRRRARRRWRRSRRRARADPRADRPERQRQDDDPERHLRLLPAGRGHDAIGGATSCRRAPRKAAPSRHRTDLPDAAHRRRGSVLRQRHDRRRRIAAHRVFESLLARLPRHPPRRSDARERGLAALRRRRSRWPRRTFAPTGCSTASCASWRSPAR